MGALQTVAISALIYIFLLAVTTTIYYHIRKAIEASAVANYTIEDSDDDTADWVVEESGPRHRPRRAHFAARHFPVVDDDTSGLPDGSFLRRHGWTLIAGGGPESVRWQRRGKLSEGERGWTVVAAPAA